MSTAYCDTVLPLALAEKTSALTLNLSANADLFDRFPVADYADSLVTCCQGYKHIPGEFQEWSRTIEHEFGCDTVERYHQLLLLNLIQRFQEIADVKLYHYHDSVLPLFHKVFSSIMKRIDKPLKGHFMLGKTGFDKDLGFSTQNLFPCGAQLVNRASGVERSSLLKGTFSQGWSLWRFMLQRIGGFKSLYELHTDSRLWLDEFNPAGWTTCYRRIAEMMKLDSHIKGVCGGSWWFDPVLAEISPRLAFLHSLPVQHGARVFFMGVDESSTRDATSYSPERRQLYDQNKYQPKKYLMVWGREDLLTWAANKS